MRIRVKLDATKPLAHRKTVKIGDGEAVWVHLAYEQLLKFCYYYGTVRHYHNNCNKWLSIKDQINEDRLPYEQWL